MRINLKCYTISSISYMESAGIINEIWRSVDLYPNYQVSNIGRLILEESGILERVRYYDLRRSVTDMSETT